MAITDRLTSLLPSLSWPKIGRSVDVPIYLVHNSPDKEDYFFTFDFEQFVECSKTGIFVRPRMWSDRFLNLIGHICLTRNQRLGGNYV